MDGSCKKISDLVIVFFTNMLLIYFDLNSDQTLELIPMEVNLECGI